MRNFIDIIAEAAETPDLSFVKQRYAPDQARLLIQMNKSHQNVARREITPFHLIPSWFGNEPAPKGFARIKAPVLPPERRGRVMALYHFAQAGDDRVHRIAAVYANVLLWATMFPSEIERHYKVDQVFDFDPENVAEWVAQNNAFDTRAYAAAFDLNAADCVRIAYNRL